jgi:hypothetical protein
MLMQAHGDSGVCGGIIPCANETYPGGEHCAAGLEPVTRRASNTATYLFQLIPHYNDSDSDSSHNQSNPWILGGVGRMGA